MGTNDPYITAFLDRHGGVSSNPYDSMNVGFHVGDRPEAVSENRLLLKKKLGVNFLLSAKQVHGDQVFCLEEKPETDMEVEGYDALITRCRGVGLIVQQADCQGILLYDTIREAVGAVHCGWRGSVIGLVGKTVKEMAKRFGTDPSNIMAEISPSLGPCCAEFVNHKDELPDDFCLFKDSRDHFNFWEISKKQLCSAGIPEGSITASEICTACNSNYFSYRRAKREGNGVTGRSCSIIALR